MAQSERIQSMTREEVLKNLAHEGVVLPQPAASVANYIGFTVSGNLVIISGQLPMEHGSVTHHGHLGNGVTLEEGYKAARLCAINILAQLSQAISGDWSRVIRCVRLGGFVASSPDFTDHPKVINGASDFMVRILGPIGRHARAAVGVSSIPLGACVEVEATFEIS